MRPFFLGTGALLYYMAFVFAGKGTMELIEGKLIGSTFVSWMPTAPLLGLYPYVQTLAPKKSRSIPLAREKKSTI